MLLLRPGLPPPAPGSPGLPPPSNAGNGNGGTQQGAWKTFLLQGSVAVLSLVLITIVAAVAIGLQTSEASTIAGAAFTALGTVVTAFLGLKATGEQAQRTQEQAKEATKQANTATIIAAHLPHELAGDALSDAGLRAPGPTANG